MAATKHPRSAPRIGEFIGSDVHVAQFSLHATPQLLSAQWLLEHYQLRLLGSGTIGAVFRAAPRDTERGRLTVAIKVFCNPDDRNYGTPEQMKDEADQPDILYEHEVLIQSLLTALYANGSSHLHAHAPIVKAYDWASAVGPVAVMADGLRLATMRNLERLMPDASIRLSCIVMELIAGHSLAVLLHDNSFDDGTYSAALIDIMAQLLLALHSLQVAVEFVHYDLKPDNIMVRQLAEPAVFAYDVDCATKWDVRSTFEIKIADFGMARMHFEQAIEDTDTKLVPRAGGRLGSAPASDQEAGYAVSDQTYQHYAGNNSDFKPWADVVFCVMRILHLMPYYRMERLPRHVWLLFAACLDMDVVGRESGNRADMFVQARDEVRRLATGDQDVPTMRLSDRCLIATDYVLSPTIDSDPVTPLRVLRACSRRDGPLEAHATYRATVADVVRDMTIRAGTQSAAALPAEPVRVPASPSQAKRGHNDELPRRRAAGK